MKALSLSVEPQGSLHSCAHVDQSGDSSSPCEDSKQLNREADIIIVIWFIDEFHYPIAVSVNVFIGFSHVIEIYDFHPSLKTKDLLHEFQKEYRCVVHLVLLST